MKKTLIIVLLICIFSSNSFAGLIGMMQRGNIESALYDMNYKLDKLIRTLELKQSCNLKPVFARINCKNHMYIIDLSKISNIDISKNKVIIYTQNAKFICEHPKNIDNFLNKLKEYNNKN